MCARVFILCCLGSHCLMAKRTGSVSEKPAAKKPKAPPAAAAATPATSRNVGPLTCSACKKKASSGVAWGDVVTKQNGRAEPVGTKCAQCGQLWQRGFWYLSWDHFASFIVSEEIGSCMT